MISFTKGPEALVIDSKRGLAYTNFAKTGQTIPIDIKTHHAAGSVAEWLHSYTRHGAG